MSEVKLQGIAKFFGEKNVLKSIDLHIQDGEFLTLVGPSGCGKSTLLRIIAGLEAQTSGNVELAGESMNGIRPSQRDLAMVFQSYALYPHLSVFENIAVPLRMRLLNKWQRLPFASLLIPKVRRIHKKIHGRINETAELLGLESMLDSKPGKLSGGQRQRIAVGRAIVRNPKAFLFDEPLSNLDAKLRVHMRTEITRLHESLGATFIYVTHDQVEAMTMSDRIAVMMDGEIIQLGTASEVYDKPIDIRVAQFIGSPKINLFDGNIDLKGDILLRGYLLHASLIEDVPGSKVIIGIRPEKIRIIKNDEMGLHGRVELIENLGSEMFIHVQILDKEAPVILRAPRETTDTIQLKDIVSIGFSSQDILLFNEQGIRLETHQLPMQIEKQQEALHA